MISRKNTVLVVALAIQTYLVSPAFARTFIQSSSQHLFNQIQAIEKSIANTERAAGQIIVQLKDTPSIASAQMSLVSGLQSSLGQDAVLSVQQFKSDALLHKITLKNDADLISAIVTLRDQSQVLYAEPNFLYHVEGYRDSAHLSHAVTEDQKVHDTSDAPVVNDPDFGKLWGIQNIGQKDAAGSVGVAGVDVNVLPLWNQGITGSKDILVAVIDTGFDWTHPDLAANLYTNEKEIPDNGIDDDQNGFIDDVHGWNFVGNNNNSRDDNDHGSHCSGTIGGVGNNGVGVAGVNWNVSILPVKFLDADGSGYLEAAVESIKYATLMKARVLSNSWGGGGYSDIMKAAIEGSRDAGALFAAAAGNSNSNNDIKPSYPASYPVENVISVAAINNKGARAEFSNFGQKSVHVAAPGVKVFSTVRGGQYDTFSGTSMATPHVSGVAALLLSVHPEWTFSELKNRLIKTSVPVSQLRRVVASRGRVDALNALNNIETPSQDPDESLWKDREFKAESPHPYSNNGEYRFPIHVPGAKFIRVHFEKIQTEETYDAIQILYPKSQPDGSVLNIISETLSGTYENLMSDYIESDRVELVFRSDRSIDGWGFNVDKIQVITETAGE